MPEQGDIVLIPIRYALAIYRRQNLRTHQLECA